MALAQHVHIADGGSIRIEHGGSLRSGGDVLVAGGPSARFELGSGGRLQLGDGSVLAIGNGVQSGRLQAGGSPLPLITSDAEGSAFFSAVVTSTGILSVSGLELRSLDAGGLTLQNGAVLDNGAPGAVSGLVFDVIQPGGTYLRFLHTSGRFTVSECVFGESHRSDPFNISTPAATVPSALLITATNCKGPRAGSQFENDHGAGTDNLLTTSTINWGTQEFSPRRRSGHPPVCHLGVSFPIKPGSPSPPLLAFLCALALVYASATVLRRWGLIFSTRARLEIGRPAEIGMILAIFLFVRHRRECKVEPQAVRTVS